MTDDSSAMSDDSSAMSDDSKGPHNMQDTEAAAANIMPVDRQIPRTPHRKAAPPQPRRLPSTPQAAHAQAAQARHLANAQAAEEAQARHLADARAAQGAQAQHLAHAQAAEAAQVRHLANAQAPPQAPFMLGAASSSMVPQAPFLLGDASSSMLPQAPFLLGPASSSMVPHTPFLHHGIALKRIQDTLDQHDALHKSTREQLYQLSDQVMGNDKWPTHMTLWDARPGCIPLPICWQWRRTGK